MTKCKDGFTHDFWKMGTKDGVYFCANCNKTFRIEKLVDLSDSNERKRSDE
ncbi:unnamed protein product [marine sediment metagenome]|uniref:Uncharacterized protein n=1 Tax=marine sediment metagenome TaxID=412755 RepID=X1L6F3_9ZZZZ